MFVRHFWLKRAIALLVVIGISVAVAQTTPELNPRHPDRYTVARGDTLWDIAATFLRDPWFWPEIWQGNPQVENPHLIYPGDVLSLVYIDGLPRVISDRDIGRADRLSPQARSEPLEDAVPTISADTIRAFLSRASVLTKDEAKNLPYIVATQDGHLMAGAGNDVYVRGTDGGEGTTYNVVHVGDKLIDPDTRDVLGYEGIFVGQGRVRRAGDPTTLYLTDSSREALEGDRIVPDEVDIPLNFIPRPPDNNIDGSIVSVIDGLSLIGQYQVVVLNRGSNHGLDAGHVLRVYQKGETIRDRTGGGAFLGEKVRLPDESAGTAMVFRTYDRVSYALIMHATTEIHVLDAVRNP